jgi:nitrilase
LFNSQLFIDRNGKILGKHQKLVPTSGEKLVHAGGHGDTLRTFQTEYGRISGLICGENSNPLAILALLAESTAIHVASWPSIGRRQNIVRPDRAAMVGRSFAFMAKAFVINACSPLTPEMQEILAYTAEDKAFLQNPAVAGGSTIIDPTSRIIAGPMGAEEGILYADIDLEECVRQRMMHDFSGHYNRPDVFTLLINESAPEICRRVQQTEEARTHTNPVKAVSLSDSAESNPSSTSAP